MSDDKIIFFGEDRKAEIEKQQDNAKKHQIFHAFFRELFKLNNVSFLFGTGPSIPLGAKSMGEMYDSAVAKLDASTKKVIEAVMEKYGNKNDFENFLGLLYQLCDLNKKGVKTEFPVKDEDINEFKKAFFELCDFFDNMDEKEAIKKVNDHRIFISKILTRSLALKRANIFTTNYDLVLEKAMDEEGVICVNGFVGNTSRKLKPESFNYDYYFPATTTEGKVHRLDKVIHFYKLHGSINWLRTSPTPDNPYGVEEKDIGLVRGYDDKGDVMIYPTPAKENLSTMFPYSDLFRKFANIIQQPQSVLCTIGYGFGDEHINRLIKEALTIPSFQLVVVNKSETDGMGVFLETKDPRISVIIGEEYGVFHNFVENVLPNIEQLEMKKQMQKTLKILFREHNNDGSDDDDEQQPSIPDGDTPF